MTKKTKAKTISTVIIKLMDESYEITLNDSALYDDVLLEACTRLLEDNIKNKNLNVTAFMEAKFKNEKNTHLYNTYKVLINGSFHRYAENLRKTCIYVWKVDLSKEPIKSNVIWKTKIKTL